MDKCLRTSCLFLLTLATLALSACSTIAPPVALDAVPVYPGAEHIDPSQDKTAAAADRQAKRAMANGHKNEIRAFLLPAGTTGAQIKAFYVSKLAQFGGQVTIMLEDDAPLGNITLDHGMQALSIEYDHMDESQPPVLIIDSFIPNGNR